MDVLDLRGSLRFSPEHHVHTELAKTPFCSISVVGWEPGQTSPIHFHPTADEVYHVLEGEGLFHDGRQQRRLGPGDTVIFVAGEVHRVQSVTRMVLYRVQAGADRLPGAGRHRTPSARICSRMRRARRGPRVTKAVK